MSAGPKSGLVTPPEAAVYGDSEYIRYRDILQPSDHTLQPILDPQANLSRSIQKACQDCIGAIGQYSTDEGRYQRAILSFFEVLLPNKDWCFRDTDFLITAAGPKCDMTDVLVKDGLTWGEISAFVEHRDWCREGAAVRSRKSSESSKKALRQASERFGCILPDFFGVVWTVKAPPALTLTTLDDVELDPLSDCPAPPDAESHSSLTASFCESVRPVSASVSMQRSASMPLSTPTTSASTPKDARKDGTKGKKKEAKGKRKSGTTRQKEAVAKGKQKVDERIDSKKRTATVTSRATQELRERGRNGYSFCPFLTGELKPRPDQAIEGIAREMCYLHGAYQLSGCFIGFVVVHLRFSRMVMLNEQIIVMETSNAALHGRLQTVTEALDQASPYDDMPHLLGGDAIGLTTGHIASWAVLWNTATYAASLVADLAINTPLCRLEAPDFSLIPSWSMLADLVSSARGESFAPDSQTAALSFRSTFERMKVYAAAGDSEREKKVTALPKHLDDHNLWTSQGERLQEKGKGKEGCIQSAVDPKESGASTDVLRLRGGSDSGSEGGEGQASGTESLSSCAIPSLTFSTSTDSMPPAASSNGDGGADAESHAIPNTFITFQDTPDASATDSDSEEDDPIASEHQATQDGLAQLLDLGVRVFWITPDFMSALVQDGVEGVLVARPKSPSKEGLQPF